MKEVILTIALTLVVLGCGSEEQATKSGATLEEACRAASQASVVCDNTTISNTQCDEMFGTMDSNCHQLLVGLYDCVVAEQACNEISMARRCAAEVNAYGSSCP